MENFQDRGVWIRIRIQFVLRGWIRIRTISDRIRNPAPRNGVRVLGHERLNSDLRLHVLHQQVLFQLFYS